MSTQVPKLEVVVANWFPRFIANDLDYLDVRRTLDAIQTWDGWAEAWEATADSYVALGEQAATEGAFVTAGQHLRRAALTLHFGQFVLTEDPARREALHRRQIELYRRAAPWLSPPAEPYRLTSGAATVHGYVRLPPARGLSELSPVVVLIPGLESTKEQFSSFEPYFLERGVATVSMEGPGQGEAWYDQPFDLDSYLAAYGEVLVALTDRDQLDPTRVAVIGTSFGGFLALRCAAEGPGLAGVVAMAGPYELTLDELQPVLQAGFTRLSGADDVDDAQRRLSNVTLAGQLERIDAPVLLIHGDTDSVIPVEHGDRIAAELGALAEYDRIAGGNHSCQNLHTIVRPRVADWVATRLGVHSPVRR